jgi:hypothetical protein
LFLSCSLYSSRTRLVSHTLICCTSPSFSLCSSYRCFSLSSCAFFRCISSCRSIPFCNASRVSAWNSNYTNLLL